MQGFALGARWTAVLLALLASGGSLAATPAATTDQPPASQELIYQGEATSILGRSVHDPTDEAIGRIVDVLVDDQGAPRAAVIDFGGFMGLGSRKIAVAWRALHFQPAEQHRQIRIDLTVDQIKATPEFHPAQVPQAPPMTVAAPPPPATPAVEQSAPGH